MKSRVIFAVLLMSPLAACSESPRDLNREMAIGGTYRPAGFRSASALAAEDQPPPAPTVPPRSVVGLARDNWGIVTVSVPNERPEHQPIYTRNITEDTGPARNRGQYPTVASANELRARNSNEMQLLEAVEAPLAAAADIVLFVPRALFLRPWQTARTGTEPYRRAPNPRGSLSPVIARPKDVKDPGAAPVQVPIGELPPLESQ